jgi:hypothetical protein
MAGYIDPTTHEYVKTRDVTFLASSARTATASSDALDCSGAHTVRVVLDVTAASGTTPTLDISLQTRRDASDTWRTVGSFTQITDATGDQIKSFSGLDRQVKLLCTIAGTTPSFTFSAAAEFMG